MVQERLGDRAKVFSEEGDARLVAVSIAISGINKGGSEVLFKSVLLDNGRDLTVFTSVFQMGGLMDNGARHLEGRSLLPNPTESLFKRRYTNPTSPTDRRPNSGLPIRLKREIFDVLDLAYFTHNKV